MSTLTPETPLDGVWDHEPGRDFSEGNSTPEVGHDGGDSPGVVAARADALNDTLRPIDRCATPRGFLPTLAVQRHSNRVGKGTTFASFSVSFPTDDCV